MRAQHLCRRKKDCFTIVKRRTKCKKFICCPKKKRRFVPAFGTAITDPPLVFVTALGIPTGSTQFTGFQPVVAENVTVESTGIRVQRSGCYEVGGAASLVVFVAALVATTAPIQIALTRNGTVIPGTETTLVPTGIVLAVGATFTAEIPERQIFLNAGDLIDLTFTNTGAAIATVAVGVTGVLGVGRVFDSNCSTNGFGFPI
ncbi:hypothetical protein [Laceyella putida]|uniref:BclA C-terminal domain-containing protein n=1 Tax=Laceyella putida TaxID=110101 RepID=A0ABW2RL40_9BACL